MYKILNKLNQPDDIKELSNEELKRLAVEIRDFLLTSVSKTGGHLSSNLGIVELSIALHKIYNSPTDKIIFDVGHQAYVHKILTGRRDDFDTLRQHKGMSGFLKKNESDHDCFEAGHSSTSISAAAGFSKARTLNGGKHEIVAVIGDGALTGGMAFEALNHIGHTKERVTVVLNDNEMSISENVGGLSTYLSRLRTTTTYYKLKDEAHQMLDQFPLIGKPVVRGIQRFKGSLKSFFVPGILFENLGLTYIGPIDGHNIEAIEDALSRAKNVKGPCLVHVVTKKGKGYLPAEQAPDLYHGVGKFDVQKGISASSNSTFSDVFGEKLIELANKHANLVAITAAMPSGTGLSAFKEAYPDRYVDVGIAEQHAVTYCAGMATEGLRPVFAVYSTFLQRAYDQVLHDVCIQNLPVIFAIDRAGLVGQDGETHHGVFDIAFLKHLPHMTLYTPMNAIELECCLEDAIENQNGPVAIRYPRGTAYRDMTAPVGSSTLPTDRLTVPLAQPVCLTGDTTGETVVVSIGHMTHHVIKALEMLSDEVRKRVTALHLRQIKPFDIHTLEPFLIHAKRVICIEDGMIEGGFGQSFITELQKIHSPHCIEFIPMGYPMTFIEHGDVSVLYSAYGLDATGIVSQITKEHR